MRIQTRLFLVIGALVLALVGIQLWLHQRQLRAVEQGLGLVATSVGRDLLEWHFAADGEVPPDGKTVLRTLDPNAEDVQVMVFTDQAGDEFELPLDKLPESKDDEAGGQVRHYTFNHSVDIEKNGGVSRLQHREIRVEVVTPEGEESVRELLVADREGDLTRIPIPTAPTAESVQDTMRQGLVYSGGLLLVGLAAAAVVAHRLGGPLKDLARRAEHLGSGEFGLRVPVTAGGEVGELQGAFDRLSVRLAELEREREQWRRREHLAQLGDLARGLAHTVRNPLHTLGLAMEELAGEAAPGDPRVASARTQIRRVDRWVCSFLAIGAGDATEPAPVPVAEVVEDVVLEAAQQGGRVELSQCDDEAVILGVAPALRAAVSNLVENAVQAAPDEPVSVSVEVSEGTVAVVIRDRGPGLPQSIREHLFSPHVSERPGGAGMGLYLAQRLVQDLHEGALEVDDAEGGGTVAKIVLPRAGSGS